MAQINTNGICPLLGECPLFRGHFYVGTAIRSACVLIIERCHYSWSFMRVSTMTSLPSQHIWKTSRYCVGRNFMHSQNQVTARFGVQCDLGCCGHYWNTPSDGILALIVGF